MISSILLTAILAVCSISSFYNGSEELQWKGFGIAVIDAKTSGKKVLVDVYTTWCGWCKKMDRDVYADDKVMAYLREHFEVVKLNAEAATEHVVQGQKLTERQIAKAYGANSYPTTVFLSAEGEAITAIPGYIKADMFLNVLQYIHEEHYKNTGWNEFLQSRQKQ